VTRAMVPVEAALECPPVAEVVGIIQARMGSTRLPGKIVAPLIGHPLLEILWERIRAARAVDEWWLATSDSPADELTAAWGLALGMRVYRGDSDDVLSRFAAIVRDRRPSLVIRLTADDPFTDAIVVDMLAAQAQAQPSGTYVVGDRGGSRRLPLGYLPEAVGGAALLYADEATRDEPAHHRAHVTSILWESPEKTRNFDPPRSWPDRPGWRWTVDTATDLQMADAALRLLGDGWRSAGYEALVAALDARPDVANLNAGVHQKELVQG
jgi:spore coat polysaccharide biosynthesis protein SpsF